VEFLGLFWLKDGSAARFVWLYAEDSNNDQRLPNDPAVGLPGPTPNKFALLAIYRDEAGKWRQSRLYSASCVDCRQAWQVDLEGAIVELKPWVIFRGDETPVAFAEKETLARKAKHPFFKRIRFAKGKLIIEESNYIRFQLPREAWDMRQFRPGVRLECCELLPQQASGDFLRGAPAVGKE
jgi:hypothetical protein